MNAERIKQVTYIALRFGVALLLIWWMQACSMLAGFDAFTFDRESVDAQGDAELLEAGTDAELLEAGAECCGQRCAECRSAEYRCPSHGGWICQPWPCTLCL